METGSEIEVRNGYASKTVAVAQVARGRVSVRWPFVGEFEVDLVTGELVLRDLSGVHSVNEAGRVIGTRVNVTAEDLPRLDSLEVGAILRLDSGATAEVVDVLRSEGIVRIFVHSKSPHESGLWQKPWRTGYRVTSSVLGCLRESAGVVSRKAG